MEAISIPFHMRYGSMICSKRLQSDRPHKRLSLLALVFIPNKISERQTGPFNLIYFGSNPIEVSVLVLLLSVLPSSNGFGACEQCGCGRRATAALSIEAEVCGHC